MPKVAFLTRGGENWGTGHLHRVSWLAAAILAQQCEDLAIEIVCLDTPEARQFWQQQGLSAPCSFHSATEAGELLAVISGDSGAAVDLVVIDWLDSPAALVAGARAIGSGVILLDDYGPAQQEASIVINCLLAPLEEAISRTDRGCIYSGVKYLQLPLALLKLRGTAAASVRALETELAGPPPPAGPVRAVLISCGGRPNHQMIDIALEGLQACAFEGRVIVMPAPGDSPASSSLDLECVPAGPDFHAIMAAADLAILAGGLTLYEAAFLGVPTVAVPLRSSIPGRETHQLDTAHKLAAAGCCTVAGLSDTTTAEKVADKVGELLADRDARARMSAAGMQLTDGRGLQRTVDMTLDALETGR